MVEIYFMEVYKLNKLLSIKSCNFSIFYKNTKTHFTLVIIPVLVVLYVENLLLNFYLEL